MKDIPNFVGRMVLFFAVVSTLVSESEGGEAKLSDQEIAKTLNMYHPSEAQMQAISKGGPEAVKAMDEMLQGISRQSVTISQLLLSMESKKYEQRIAALELEITALKGRSASSDSDANRPSLSSAPASPAGAIESSIDSDFDGLEMDRVFKLTNGQVWQQVDAYIFFHFAFMPKVLIYKSSTSWMMKVDGVERAVRVQRLK
ncbi:MAG TPA: hypothetical protein VG897_03425 [Terriglobales bacterium]|nr:hypothetical protein [Terriglobales bacterium]